MQTCFWGARWCGSASLAARAGLYRRRGTKSSTSAVRQRSSLMFCSLTFSLTFQLTGNAVKVNKATCKKHIVSQKLSPLLQKSFKYFGSVFLGRNHWKCLVDYARWIIKVQNFYGGFFSGKQNDIQPRRNPRATGPLESRPTIPSTVRWLRETHFQSKTLLLSRVLLHTIQLFLCAAIVRVYGEYSIDRCSIRRGLKVPRWPGRARLFQIGAKGNGPRPQPPGQCALQTATKGKEGPKGTFQLNFHMKR